MTIRTLALIPIKNSYGTQASEEVLRVQLDGGAGRYRRGPTNTFQTINCIFRCTREGYRYFRAFYRTATMHGSLSFFLQAVSPLSTLTLHKAQFVPGSIVLQSNNGNRYTVAAQVVIESRQQ